MRSFLHDGKRLIITAPYCENSAAISNGKNGVLDHGDHNINSLKNGHIKDDLTIPHVSPTSSTCSVAGSVNSTFGSTR
jgi:hypothetical protein